MVSQCFLIWHSFLNLLYKCVILQHLHKYRMESMVGWWESLPSRQYALSNISNNYGNSNGLWNRLLHQVHQAAKGHQFVFGNCLQLLLCCKHSWFDIRTLFWRQEWFWWWGVGSRSNVPLYAGGLQSDFPRWHIPRKLLHNLERDTNSCITSSFQPKSTKPWRATWSSPYWLLGCTGMDSRPTQSTMGFTQNLHPRLPLRSRGHPHRK